MPWRARLERGKVLTTDIENTGDDGVSYLEYVLCFERPVN
jgi:hypothetical protein